MDRGTEGDAFLIMAHDLGQGGGADQGHAFCNKKGAQDDTRPGTINPHRMASAPARAHVQTTNPSAARARERPLHFITGRWAEQVSRLHQAYVCIFFIVEGDLRECELGVPYNALWSAIINASLRRNAHLIRTADINETASVVRLLVQKGCATPPPPSGIAPPTALTKRKRDADPGLVFMRQLMCVPTVSENVARKLYEKFGTLPALQDALREKKFPKVALDNQRSIGKARREKLAAYLL